MSGFLRWAFVSDDERTLYCAEEGGGRLASGKCNLMVWTRTGTSDPFVRHRYIEIEGITPLTGRSPRYVAATKELFFTGMKQLAGIWIVRNFDPSQVGGTAIKNDRSGEPAINADVGSGAPSNDSDSVATPVGTWVERRPGTPGGNRVRTFQKDGTLIFFAPKSHETSKGTWRMEGKRVYFRQRSADDEKCFEIVEAKKDHLQILMMGQRQYTWNKSK